MPALRVYPFMAPSLKSIIFSILEFGDCLQVCSGMDGNAARGLYDLRPIRGSAVILLLLTTLHKRRNEDVIFVPGLQLCVQYRLAPIGIPGY